LQVCDRILCRELIDLVYGETDHGLLGNLGPCKGLFCSGEQISSQPLPALLFDIFLMHQILPMVHQLRQR
jgi:hypothetical protein